MPLVEANWHQGRWHLTQATSDVRVPGTSRWQTHGPRGLHFPPSHASGHVSYATVTFDIVVAFESMTDQGLFMESSSNSPRSNADDPLGHIRHGSNARRQGVWCLEFNKSYHVVSAGDLC